MCEFVFNYYSSMNKNQNCSTNLYLLNLCEVYIFKEFKLNQTEYQQKKDLSTY